MLSWRIWLYWFIPSHNKHDDVLKWKYFMRSWTFVRGIHRSPIDNPYKGQWRGALMFSLICAWTNGWANNRHADDLRCHRPHYDATVMKINYQSCKYYWDALYTSYESIYISHSTKSTELKGVLKPIHVGCSFVWHIFMSNFEGCIEFSQPFDHSTYGIYWIWYRMQQRGWVSELAGYSNGSAAKKEFALHVLFFQQKSKYIFIISIIHHCHDTESCKDLHSLHNQYHGCWWPGDTRSQGISNMILT